MRETEKTATEAYLDSIFPQESELIQASRKGAEELNLGRISLSAHEGRILQTLLALKQPQKVVEIGTLTGVSALYMLEALPKTAKLWTLEKNPLHVEKARQVLSQKSSVAEVEILEGDARVTLNELSTQGPFDMVFIDGNKAAYGDYLEWALAHTQSGSVIVADNIYLSGAVWGASTPQKFNEKQIRVLQDFNKKLADPNLFVSCVIPTFEGLFVAIKK